MRVVTFGEVMLRLSPPGFRRIRQSIPGTLEATFGGGELNVAVSIAVQGGQAAFLTAVPDNVITDCLLQELRKLGVDDRLVLRRPEGRFGVYFVETGADQRGGTVTYDRSGSTVSLLDGTAYDWEAAFADATWFHVTGITPALSAAAAHAASAAVHEARRRGLTVSCDLNFRKKLWRWDPQTPPVALARRVMRALVRQVDLLIANEEDVQLALGIDAEGTDVESGRLNVRGYESMARTITERFDVGRVAITLRESLSASHNNWGAMLYEAGADRCWYAPTDEAGTYRPYAIAHIVDRVGAGDSFAGALIFALQTPELADPETALRYAVAASCLKHTMPGDFNYATRAEIEALMRGSASGRVQR
ncbi:MAG: sugar kinase [Planctomycetota bacterium]|nr:MAG: sugar kinase [Planctomycetota bacterium]